MKQAIISFAGHQYLVSSGDTISVQKKGLKKGEAITFDKVIALLTDKGSELGKPYLKNVVVKGKVIEQKKGKKIRVARFRAKSRYRKVKGFRPTLYEIKVSKIEKKNGKN
jgi:large subunit ribosomal protein L21